MASFSPRRTLRRRAFQNPALTTGFLIFGLLLVVTSPSEAAEDCEAWPGEHRPLPTVSDSDPYLARWSELRAEELRVLANRWAAERPAASATLRTHAACLAPREDVAKNTPTVRITRAGQPFSTREPSRPAATPPAGTPVGNASVIAPRASEHLATVGVVEPSNATAAVRAGAPVSEASLAGPAADSVRVLGQRTDAPIEHGQARPAPVQAPTATSEPSSGLRPTENPDVEPTLGPVPRRKDPRVGRDKPFPPPRLDPRRLADESPAPGGPEPTPVVAEPRLAETAAPADGEPLGTVASNEVGATPSSEQVGAVSAPEPGTSVLVDPNPQADAVPPGVLASSGGTPGQSARPDVAAAPDTSAAQTPNSSAVPVEERRAEDARRAMREAIVAAGARARVEQARRAQAAKKAVPPKPPLPSAVSTATVKPQKAATDAGTVKAAPEVARVDPASDAPLIGPLPQAQTSAPGVEAPPGPVSSSPSVSGRSGLDRVRAEVRQARFESALDVARELRDDLDSPESAPIRAELEVLAATAALALGREDEARRFFGSALVAAPGLELDSENHSPKVRELFDVVRAGVSQ